MCPDLLKVEIQETKQAIFDTKKAMQRHQLIYKAAGSVADVTFFKAQLAELKIKLNNLLTK